jgi:hypothetical protein
MTTEQKIIRAKVGLLVLPELCGPGLLEFQRSGHFASRSAACFWFVLARLLE